MCTCPSQTKEVKNLDTEKSSDTEKKNEHKDIVERYLVLIDWNN